MRIGVLSDTHGALVRAEAALTQMGEIDLLLHAGDLYADARRLAERLSIPVRAVRGNCDLHVAGPEEELVIAAGRRILVTHGHRYGVRTGHLRLLDRAREVGAEIVVFGHTHVPATFQRGGVLLFNPGSVDCPRGEGARPTYGIITVEPRDGAGGVSAQVCALDGDGRLLPGVH